MEISLFAENVLRSNSLEAKLFSPDLLTDFSPQGNSKNVPDLPSRPDVLKWADGKTKSQFPKSSELLLESGRGRILHFFANHELLALELMALALLRFPNAPKEFRLGIAHTMLEEQEHLRLYLNRMEALGVAFGDLKVNRFFWDCLHKMKHPIDYITGMSLTFEQANLDFSAHYIDEMKKANDDQTADLLQKILDDEIGHVKFGLDYFDKMRPQKSDRFAEYCLNLQIPLSPSRAKAKPFNVSARLKAGFTISEIERLAAYGGSKGRPPDIFEYNSDCELELALGGHAYTPPSSIKAFIGDLSLLSLYLSKSSDIVLCPSQPSVEFLKYLVYELKFDLPEILHLGKDWPKTLQVLSKKPQLASYQPWGWSPQACKRAQEICEVNRLANSENFLEEGRFSRGSFFQFFRKDRLPDFRAKYRSESEVSDIVFGPSSLDGECCSSVEQAVNAIELIWSRYECPALIKAPFGSASWGNRKISSSNDLSFNIRNWLSTQIKLHGAVLVEPWLDKIADLSYAWFNYDHEGFLTRFFCDSKGRYLGHYLGSWWHDLDPELKRFLFEKNGSNSSMIDHVKSLGRWVKDQLFQCSYQGAAAIDLFVYSHPVTGKNYIRLISEINPRFTMAHVAQSVRSKFFSEDKKSGVYTIIRESELRYQAEGSKRIYDLAENILRFNRKLPKDNRIILLNDWHSNPKNLVVAGVGDKAQDLILRLRKD